MLDWLINFLQALFGSIRDKERNAEVKEHVADARERADEKIKDLSKSDRDSILDGLHRDGNERRKHRS